MARAPERPVPPRVSDPDIPSRLEPAVELRARADHFQQSFAGLVGDADAAHATLTECRLTDVAVASLVLTGATLVDVAISGLRATTVSGRGARMRRVSIDGGRIGTLDLADAELDEVALRGVRVDYVSLAAARIENVVFADCTIGTLDLPHTVAARVAFDSSRADELDTRGLRAENVDLRGVEVLSFTDAGSLRGTTLSLRQIGLHAPAFAASLGIQVTDE